MIDVLIHKALCAYHGIDSNTYNKKQPRVTIGSPHPKAPPDKKLNTLELASKDEARNFYRREVK